MNLPPPITSRSNAKVKELRGAFSGRASQPGELVGLEGVTLIEEAHRSGLALETLFVREGMEASLLRSIQAARPKQIVVLSREVFDSAVDTASPQGVAAVVRIPLRAAAAARQGSGTVLVLEDVQDPGNLGTLIRSAEAFGADEIIVTPACANQWSPKAIRASAGSVFRMMAGTLPIEDALRRLRSRGTRIAGAVAQSGGAMPSSVAQLAGRVAIVIGNEGAGLSERALSLLDERVNIPCRTESLNAAIAGSLLLYEAQRQNAERNSRQEAGAMAV